MSRRAGDRGGAGFVGVLLGEPLAFGGGRFPATAGEIDGHGEGFPVVDRVAMWQIRTHGRQLLRVKTPWSKKT